MHLRFIYHAVRLSHDFYGEYPARSVHCNRVVNMIYDLDNSCAHTHMVGKSVLDLYVGRGFGWAVAVGHHSLATHQRHLAAHRCQAGEQGTHPEPQPSRYDPQVCCGAGSHGAVMCRFCRERTQRHSPVPTQCDMAAHTSKRTIKKSW